MRNLFLTVVFAFSLAGAAHAEGSRSSATNDWNSNYDFPGASATVNRLTRANLIEKQKNGGLETQVNNWSTAYSTTNVDSMNEFSISGSNNSLSTTQTSEGNTSNSAIGGMINDPLGSRALSSQ
ncbi:hypothetical protein [Azospirillum sp. ST 5-10]|uniref:hypothetical protein n=1 Tax=unclassified Azospirillum TaxID=2630922 RepID=UPI003F4A3EA3